MSDTEEVADGVNAFNFDEWANGLGLKRSTTQVLRNEELTTQETLKMLEAKDLKELGLPMGSVKLILKAVNQWNCVPVPAEPTPIEDKDDTDNVAILEGAGKTFDVLLKDPSAPVPKETASIFGQMDPRAILTIKSQTNKAIHITQFLTEKSKRRRQSRRKEFVLKSGSANSETLVLKADEEHPYLGIYMEEWGAANMRLLNHLLSSKKLRREDIEFYLAYTTKIYELAEKYEWNSVLNYDYAYRELQAEHQFQWGTFSPSMELQLLAPKRNQTPKSTQQPPTKNEDCKIFKAKGSCPFDTACKYRHPKKHSTEPASDTTVSKNILNGLQH